MASTMMALAVLTRCSPRIGEPHSTPASAAAVCDSGGYWFMPFMYETASEGQCHCSAMYSTTA